MKEIIILAFLASQIVSPITTLPTFTNDFRPPGTVEIVDNFFVDEGEIRNADWKEYLEDLKESFGENSSIYKQALPDTKVWLKEDYHTKPFEENYFSHPSYDDYPVVGISHKQAVDYCTWRTEAVTKMLKRLKIKGPKKFEYRLPTQTEWELVANANYDKKQKKVLEKYKADNNRKCNMRFGDISGESNEASLTPAPTRSYLPNKLGVYNIHGNVAEMVAKPGVAMGGSYRHYHKDIVPGNITLDYSSPQDWIGFRCVCEIIEF